MLRNNLAQDLCFDGAMCKTAARQVHSRRVRATFQLNLSEIVPDGSTGASIQERESRSNLYKQSRIHASAATSVFGQAIQSEAILLSN
jgi:hypothetical protein